MPILSTSQRDALRQELQKSKYAGLSVVQLAALLNAPGLLANPVPQSSAVVPKPFTVSDLLNLLSAGSLSNVLSVPANPEIVSKINSQDRPSVALWTSALKGAGLISQAECNAILAKLAETIADPSWSAQVAAGPSVKQTLFGQSVWPLPTGETVDFLTPDAVQEAL